MYDCPNTSEFRTMRVSVSRNVCEQVFQTIRRLQKRSPRQPVTQIQVQDIFKRALSKPDLSERHVRRVFRKLRENGKIIRSGRGQYWLPEYHDRKIDYLKRQLQLERDFWGTVDEQRQKRVFELELKLEHQELLYEDIQDYYEKQEILRNLRKKEKNP